MIVIIERVVELDESWVLQLRHDLDLQFHVRSVGGCLDVHVLDSQFGAALLLAAEVHDAKLAPGRKRRVN